MRWFHTGVDRLHLALMRLVFAARAFQHGVLAAPVAEHVAAIRLQMPVITPECHRYRLTAQTLVGQVEAGFSVRWGAHPALPVVLYHHGIAEMPPLKSFYSLFPPWRSVAAHLVAVRAPFHRSWWELKGSMRTLDHFLAMCAVSVVVMETLRQVFKQRGSPSSLVVGLSLGGVLAMLHHLTYGTAQRYVPLLAGPDVAHVLLTTPYRHLLHPQALAQQELLQARLNFTSALQASEPARLFPLLAQYDVDMVYTHQQACYAACGIPVVSIATGHITGNASVARLRAHILMHLAALGPNATSPDAADIIQT